MNRQEEREKASVEYQMSNNPMCIGGDAFADMIYKLNINPSFIAGAEWADEHPRKGLVDIEKVCDYLKNLGYQRYPGAPMERIIDDDELENLRKAMEE